MRFVVIEDNPADIFLLREALQHGGFPAELDHLSDGEEALATIAANSEPWSPVTPDLVMLDLNMPRAGGLEVLATLRRSPQLANVPVLVLTCSQSPEDMENAMQLGANGYIRKSTDLYEFFEKIASNVRKVLDGTH